MMMVWIETAKSLKNGDAKLQGLFECQPATKPKGEYFSMSFLTPEEMMQKKKARKMWKYVSFFVFTIVLVAGTTYLSYHL